MSVQLLAALPQFGNLSSATRQGASVDKVAKEFEAVLVGQIFQLMRQSVGSSGLFEDAPGKSVYMDMVYQELARALVHKGGGLGLAEGIRRALEKLSDSPSQGESLTQYPVSSDMGWRKDPLTGQREYHKGVDLAAEEGRPVPALSEGRVTLSGRQSGYGTTVVVESPDGVRTRYAHLSQVHVREGDKVARNQVLGQVGSSGRTTGPHLHLEMEKHGKLIHPLSRTPADQQPTEENRKVSMRTDDKNGKVNLYPEKEGFL